MKARIVKADSLKETFLPERCFLYENWGSEKVSIARARVESGVTTRTHHLEGIDEIYVIVKGEGLVEVGSLEPKTVREGDTVFIPAKTSQRITNNGKEDLVFYCVCTPRFREECYRDDDDLNGS